MIPAADNRLVLLQRAYPEWQAWLAVIEAVVRESARSNWQAGVPACPPAPKAQTPFLDSAQIAVDEYESSRWLKQLFEVGRRANKSALANLARVVQDDAPGRSLALLQASIAVNYAQIAEFAHALAVNAEGFSAVVELAALPLLQACRRSWSAQVAENWSEGYCPICGAWPAFAEEQGIERTRVLRCARCGAGWRSECLRCPYCSTTEHDKLTSLMLGSARDSRRIDACTVCRGYVKTMLVLQGCPPEELLLEDLATVELDIAAVDAGYQRPANPGFAAAVQLTVSSVNHRGESTVSV